MINIFINNFQIIKISKALINIIKLSFKNIYENINKIN